MALPIATAERIVSDLKSLLPNLSATIVKEDCHIKGTADNLTLTGTNLVRLGQVVGPFKLTIKRSGAKVSITIK
ncbi:hypothetical protein FAES_3278 [Fibrella aestuarina BUZ 2]|uniref:Uncharacterized protein n=1 Tax=Fibrella aestuarina BUZ 2 TaxID=1166018 RepID=I0KAY4_9BACT|nr:hypothetical protein [Fibrella aestuarina]CCH01287.1 hypothetical protein FAES_3278 [Fibrella aestuarina BUZ 2]